MRRWLSPPDMPGWWFWTSACLAGTVVFILLMAPLWLGWVQPQRRAHAQIISGTESMTPLTIGAGTPITQISVYTPSLTPTQISAAIGAVEQTFAVSGLTTADKVFVNAPPSQTALCPMTSARVTAANTLGLTFGNLAVALCTPVSGTYTVLAIRS